MCFPRSKFARLTAELAGVRDLGKEAALYHFTCRFNPLHIGLCDSSSSSSSSSSSNSSSSKSSSSRSSSSTTSSSSSNLVVT